MDFWSIVIGFIIGWILKWIHGLPDTTTQQAAPIPYQDEQESPKSSVLSDAIEVLVKLGYRKTEAKNLIYSIQDRLTNPSTEELVKVALRQVSDYE